MRHDDLGSFARAAVMWTICWAGPAVAQWCDATGWQVGDPDPTPRYACGMVTDTLHGTLLTFGGLYQPATGGSFESATTWEWTSGTARWRQRRSIESPSGRDSHAMAYDPIRRKVVLFGGVVDYFSAFSDTWEFDVQTGQWSRMAPTTVPAPRQGAAMVFDPVSGHTLMFGGWNDPTPVPNELWEWDGVNWALRAQTSPPPARGFATLAPESTPGRYLLFAGLLNAQSTMVDETWRLDSNTWTLLNPAHKPPRRMGYAMAPDPARRRIVLFGGRGSNPLGDTWEWDEGSGDWIQRSPAQSPSPRSWVSGALDPTTGRAVVFGGMNWSSSSPTPSDVWDWDGAIGTWKQRYARIFPPMGLSPSMAYDAVRRRLVLWPGDVANGSAMWEWDGHQWTTIAAATLSPQGMSLAFDGREMIAVTPVSGAFQTWAWNGAAWKRRADCPATYDAVPLLTYDSLRGRVVMFTTSVRQTWEWDQTQWLLRSTQGPPARSRSAMTFDRARGLTIVHGGQTPVVGPAMGDTWVWDGQDWANPTSGPAVVAGELCFDPSRGKTLLVCPTGTFEWGGSGSWVPLVGSQAVNRGGGVMAYHDAVRHLVLIGGSHAQGTALEQSIHVTLIRGCSCYPNCDNSSSVPTLNVNDFQCFLNKFAAADPYANCDGSTVPPALDVADFQCFLNAYAAGCN